MLWLLNFFGFKESVWGFITKVLLLLLSNYFDYLFFGQIENNLFLRDYSFSLSWKPLAKELSNAICSLFWNDVFLFLVLAPSNFLHYLIDTFFLWLAIYLMQLFFFSFLYLMKASCISLLIFSRYGKMDGVASYLDKRGTSTESLVISEAVVLNLRRTLGRSHLLLVAILIL